MFSSLQTSGYANKKMEGELDIIHITHPLFEAKISYQGAQLYRYSSKNSFQLWCSSEANFKNNKAIRGGIPLCWPWFGGKEKSISHGFARILQWELKSIEEDALHVSLIWSLTSSQESKKYWPYDFELILDQRLSQSIEYSLEVKNCDTQSFTTTQAFHTYFNVDDINALSIPILENKSYFNQLTCKQEKEAKLSFTKEIDRIYQEDFSSIDIYTKDKCINLVQRGCHSLVLWNPYKDKSKQLQDMKDNEYKQMICLESANVKENSITIKENSIHTTHISISAENISE